MFGEKLHANIQCSCYSGIFGDVGTKYLNKYRSLSYNIKVPLTRKRVELFDLSCSQDSKNDGLWRRILLRDVSPIEVLLTASLNLQGCRLSCTIYSTLSCVLYNLLYTVHCPISCTIYCPLSSLLSSAVLGLSWYLAWDHPTLVGIFHGTTVSE